MLPRPISSPDLTHEARLGGLVAGVDEVGRGPWAGPVVAAAVIIPAHTALPPGINDSKKLSATRRDALFDALTSHTQFGIGQASVEEIDELNILQATGLAMRRALHALPIPPDAALIDGNRIPNGLTCRAECLVKGDSRSLSIAVASIIAKVTRDRLMARLAAQHPFYGWEKNAGYGTKAHQEGLRLHGVTPHHRRSFRPIRECLEADAQPQPAEVTA